MQCPTRVRLTVADVIRYHGVSSVHVIYFSHWIPGFATILNHIVERLKLWTSCTVSIGDALTHNKVEYLERAKEQFVDFFVRTRCHITARSFMLKPQSRNVVFSSV